MSWTTVLTLTAHYTHHKSQLVPPAVLQVTKSLDLSWSGLVSNGTAGIAFPSQTWDRGSDLAISCRETETLLLQFSGPGSIVPVDI